jgi:hypothetical protein
MMDGLWQHLPGAVAAGTGIAFCAYGYESVRFHVRTFAIVFLATLGAFAGSAIGSPLLGAALAAIGGALGWFVGPWLMIPFVGFMALLGGAVVGAVLAAFTRFTEPVLLIGATAAGCAIIALLDVRLMTILWTSISGAAVATFGLLSFSEHPARLILEANRQALIRRYSLLAVLMLLLLAVAGTLFQFRTTRPRRTPAPQPAPAPSH